MKTAEMIAEKLWEKHSDDTGYGGMNREMSRSGFIAALHEYGEIVRERAAVMCKTVICDCDMSDGHDCVVHQCAAAIERMPLP